ncbi:MULTISPECIES: aminotransferase A [Peribacillus]|uniref:Aminotransferase n=1 Tax=Peribacillus castrilensis TaxID=2897690 RepID=A0AAW9NAV7_9BACI|nr:aminotransferase A [Peribacillus frigoritolerans]MEC0274046.1 aminotransferase A [Peribacillus castrilensis]MDM5310203.1 aminotransferase A [Peribacillus frigoritolerans]MEC0299820.1 aminotransferase A [Peribacillus castrilensis]MEC0343630.1 aminotransferase A [Peribacillus castrilensis]TFH60667.1 aminotransferase A [Peribacillus frigoritolerans]
MEHLINPLVKDVQISGIRKFYNMVADIEGTISLTIGQPDFPTPTHIKEAAKQAIDNDYTVYTHNAGYLELREAASNYVKDKYKLNYDPANEVIVTSGASEGIDIAFRTILIPGNEVILPGPVYPGYEPIIKMCGATPVYADTTKNGFRLTADILEKYITEHTRCIVLPYPSNPTGVTLTAEELLDIAELVRGKDIFILADEIYSELVFDQEHVSIATFLKEQTIVLNGLSKSHSMTGWRIGLLFAPAAISQHLLKVHQYNVTCAASISQRAALAALTAGRNDAIPMKTEYARRREYVYSRLQAMKLEIVKPNGAFYFFIKLPEGYASSLDFCLKLVQQEKVAVVPGDAFSPLGEGYFRISYAYSMETLEKALDRIEAFLAKK